MLRSEIEEIIDDQIQNQSDTNHHSLGDETNPLFNHSKNGGRKTQKTRL